MGNEIFLPLATKTTCPSMAALESGEAINTKTWLEFGTVKLVDIPPELGTEAISVS